jgi:hypothetical protein
VGNTDLVITRLPFFKILAIAQIALLVRRHLRGLTRAERRRLAELARHGTKLTPAERAELRTLVAKLEPRAFAIGAANHISPFPLPRRMLGKLR